MQSLIQRIHRVYAKLPQGERKAADLVLESPGDLVFWTASELAEKAGVSNATVSRLFRRLEYVNYEEARRDSRTMRAQGSPLYLVGGDTGADDGLPNLAEYHRTEAGLIEASLKALDPQTLSEVSSHLANAPKVRIAGFRNSRFLAEYATAALAQFRPDVEMLVPAGQTLAEGIAGTGRNDMILIIGLRRRPAFFTDFVRAAGSCGAEVALLADHSVRTTPALVRWTMTCSVETPQLIDSYAGAMAILRTLALSTVRHLGSRGNRHLERLETLHETLSELE